MKKWYFSHDGEITGPFTQVEAIDFVQQQPDSYGWHPSFTQWLPVSHIGEFTGQVPTLESPAQVPKALITEFSSKRHELRDRIVKMDESIKFSKTYLYELEQEINIYKRLTHTLSDAVKNNIGSIESKYEGYQKTFEDLINAVSIAKSEIAEVTGEFDKRVEARAKDMASLPTPPKAVPTTAPGVAATKLKIETEEEAAPLDPVPTKAVALDPVATKAVSMDPVATKPGSLDPVASKPGSLDPVASRTGSMDPVAMKPSSSATAGSNAGPDPVATKPGSLDAVATRVIKADNLAEIDAMSASTLSQAVQATLAMDKDDLASQALLEKFNQTQAGEDDDDSDQKTATHTGADAKETATGQARITGEIAGSDQSAQVGAAQ
jgi:hypothetical protein